jgi:hypothetical protein
VVVFGHRVEKGLAVGTRSRAGRGRIGGIEWIEAVKSLCEDPTIVSPLYDHVDLLEQILPDVCDIEVGSAVAIVGRSSLGTLALGGSVSALPSADRPRRSNENR